MTVIGERRTLTYSFLSKLGGKSMSAAAYNDASALVSAGWHTDVFAPSFARPVTGAHRQRSTLPGIAPLVYRLPNFKQDWGGLVRDTLHDLLTARMMSSSDVFHGWARGCLLSQRRAKRTGGYTILEIATMHAGEQDVLLNRERREFAYTRRPIHHPWGLKRHEVEYAEADLILVWSIAARDSFITRGIQREKVVLHPPRYSFRLRPTDRQGPMRPHRVLFVGQICLRKGVHYLLQAWDLLRHPNAELWLCGELGDDIRPYLRNHPPSKAVRLTGFIQDPSRLYESASVFVLPSVEDGFGLVVAEAMSYGVPVVVSENVGARDLVCDQESGLVVPIRDAAALATALDRLLGDDAYALRLGVAAQQAIKQRAYTAPEITDVYREFISDRADPTIPRKM
ncbi:MAG: glycosyltransferase family 4 protein [Chloroflexi bacterium]|nr:glycosyltransferase family 4 protein [Chloroflexota bacterium]